jgi:hypothetical protein
MYIVLMDVKLPLPSPRPNRGVAMAGFLLLKKLASIISAQLFGLNSLPSVLLTLSGSLVTAEVSVLM